MGDLGRRCPAGGSLGSVFRPDGRRLKMTERVDEKEKKGIARVSAGLLLATYGMSNWWAVGAFGPGPRAECCFFVGWRRSVGARPRDGPAQSSTILLDS